MSINTPLWFNKLFTFPVSRAFQRAAANTIALILLLILPFMVGVSIYKSHITLEDAHIEFFNSLHGKELLRVLDATVDSISKSLRREALARSAGHDEVREDKGASVLEVLKAQDFPQTRSEVGGADISCADFAAYGSRPVSYTCATAVMSDSGHAAIYTSAELTEKLGSVGALLKHSFKTQLRDKGRASDTRLERPGRDRPVPHESRLLFLYAVVPEAFDNTSWAIFYPGIFFDENYSFEERQWYKTRQKIGRFYVSAIYRDYATNNLILSLSRRELTEVGEIHLVADVLVPNPGPMFSLYSLNALLMAVAIFGYWRFYLTRRLKFQLYLILSCVCLFLAYSILALNEIIASFHASGVSGNYIISNILPFLPSGALLITAASALFAQRRTSTRRVLSYAYAVEFGCALTSAYAGNRLLTILFSSFALFRFGTAIWVKAKSEELKSPYESDTLPRRLSTYMLVAYCSWGVAQLTLLFEDFDNGLVRSLTVLLMHLGDRADLVLMNPSIFLVLLYAKAIAIYTTALYMSWEFELSFRRRLEVSENLVFLAVDSSGTIQEGHNLSPRVPIKPGTKLASYIDNEEDREEVRSFIENNTSRNSYLCRMSTVFPRRIIKLSLDRSRYAESPRTVTIHPLDQTSLFRQFSELLSKELSDLAASIAAAEPSTGSGEREAVKPVDMDFITSLPQRLNPEVILSDLKMDTQTAWSAIENKVSGHRFRDKWELDSIAPPFRLLPQRLRMSSEVWVIILDLVLRSLENHLAPGEPVAIDINLIDPRDAMANSDDPALVFSVKLPLEIQFLRAYHRAAAINIEAAQIKEHPKATSYMRDARFFLQIFNGELSVAEIDGEDLMELRLFVRCLVSK